MNTKISPRIVLLAAIVVVAAIGLYSIFTTNPSPAGIDDQNTNVNAPSVTTINYQHTQYGFNFALPASWKGYLIINGEWDGNISGPQGDTQKEKGPLISIRNPLWTAAVPRQDIPIMVFTISQWNNLQADKFHIGAAPINPSELGRNAKYVFALPARYNFAFPAGYEEVDTILQSNPLKAF